MRKLFLILSFITGFAIILMSCSDDDDNGKKRGSYAMGAMYVNSKRVIESSFSYKTNTMHIKTEDEKNYNLVFTLLEDTIHDLYIDVACNNLKPAENTPTPYIQIAGSDGSIRPKETRYLQFAFEQMKLTNGEESIILDGKISFFY